MKRANENAPFWRQLREAEKSIITFAVEATGSLRRAAETLGISPAYIITRARVLGISSPETQGKGKGKKGKKDTKAPKGSKVKPARATRPVAMPPSVEDVAEADEGAGTAEVAEAVPVTETAAPVAPVTALLVVHENAPSGTPEAPAAAPEAPIVAPAAPPVIACPVRLAPRPLALVPRPDPEPSPEEGELAFCTCKSGRRSTCPVHKDGGGWERNL